MNAAVVEGRWDIVRILLEYGAKPDCLLFEEIDEEWVGKLGEEKGRGAAERYRVFWDREKAKHR